jgi:Flp pilus assembly protein TadG
VNLRLRRPSASRSRTSPTGDRIDPCGGEESQTSAPRRRPRGQVLVLFALSIFVLTGMVALVIDVTWYWANTLKVQRAADAAALAGVIYLPGNVTLGVTTARNEAAKNGYTNGSTAANCRNVSNSVVVNPTQDGANPRRMNVTASAPVPMFFMRIFGIDCIKAERRAKAEFVLPVPMGSPENYYGIDQLARGTGFPTLAVPNASGAGTLAAKGFWGAVLTKGSDKANGDAFNPVNDITGGIANPNYDPAGYGYTVEIPTGASNGHVYVYDAAFCATSRNSATGAGGYLGVGDHWMSGTDQNNPSAVSTYFNLWDTNDTPWDTSDDSLMYSSGSLFQNQVQVDRSAAYGPIADSNGKFWAWGDGWQYDTNPANRRPTAGVAPDCSTNAYHNAWWMMPTAGLGPGTYRLQVSTTSSTDGSINASTKAENMFGLEVTSSGGTTPRIYGSGRMCAYNSLVAGTQRFYLAQIEGIHAGKTMEINLFDPGDVGGNAYMRVLTPYGGSYQRATFSYTAANGRSGTNVTEIQTASSGSNLYNDTWITIRIALPANYGTANITPPGETGPGWWKIEYQVSGGNDTTTWMVGIRGNPVHLIVP